MKVSSTQGAECWIIYGREKKDISGIILKATFTTSLYYIEGGDMMQEVLYNRNKAAAYAHRWAYGRNSKYYDFATLGGDCTNFISQCVFAGCRVMNYKKMFGWYYRNLNERTPSWSGVEFFYNFLINNKGVGPYAIKTDVENIKVGDIVQLKFSEDIFMHSLLVVSACSPADIDNILITTHTFNTDNRPLKTYSWSDIRFIHILGARK